MRGVQKDKAGRLEGSIRHEGVALDAGVHQRSEDCHHQESQRYC